MEAIAVEVIMYGGGTLTPGVPAAIDAWIGGCRQNGCSSLAAHSADIHQSKDTIRPSEPLTDAFQSEYSSSNEPFLCQNL